MADRWRVAPGVLITPGVGGEARIWVPSRRRVVALGLDELALLLRFGDGCTAEDAAAAAGIELDDAVAEAIVVLTDAGLLVPDAGVPPPPPPVRAARKRIAQVVDPDSFVEDAGGPIVTGAATIDGAPVAIAAWEPGADAGIEDVLRLQESVAREPRPLVYLLDLFSIGRDPAEFAGPRAIGRIYANQARMSGAAPQVAVVYGSLWRPAAFLPAGCDVVVLIEGDALVHIGDASAVREFTGHRVEPEELGGARMHAEASGLGHLVAASATDAAALVRRYLAYFGPRRAGGHAPASSPAALDALVPDDLAEPFAMRALIDALADDGSVLELRPRWGRAIITTLARLDGVAVGVVASDPEQGAGVLTVDACDKAARFVTLCDAYRLPLVFVADVPGFAIGRAAERDGIVRAAGRLFAAVAGATVPRLALVARKAHTAGLYAMCGPAFEPDAFLALPGASIAVFGERAAIGGVAALERQLDDGTRASLREFLRVHRDAAGHVAEVVPASRARAALIAKLRAVPERPPPPGRRVIPP